MVQEETSESPQPLVPTPNADMATASPPTFAEVTARITAVGAIAFNVIPVAISIVIVTSLNGKMDAQSSAMTLRFNEQSSAMTAKFDDVNVKLAAQAAATAKIENLLIDYLHRTDLRVDKL